MLFKGIADAVITAATPNLNHDARFLRGTMPGNSGTLQEDMLQGHSHAIDSAGDHTHSYNTIQTGSTTCAIGTTQACWDKVAAQTGTAGTHTHSMGAMTTNGIDGTPRYGSETRPLNMAVVWLMRVK